MRIQHNSPEKIEKVESNFNSDVQWCGVLCFGEEGHDYSLGFVAASYVIDVDEDKIINVKRFWYNHDSDSLSPEAEEIVLDVMDYCECDREEALNLLDDSSEWTDDWFVQQRQGLLAHVLGYDCAEGEDEQGTVYLAYCVERNLEEVDPS